MSERESPPIDLLFNRLPIGFDHNKDEIAKDYTLEDHVRKALKHNLALIKQRLDGIEEVFTELYALTSEVDTHNPDLAHQMRTAISWGRTGQLQGARWLIEALIKGLDPYAKRGVTSLQHRREGARRAQETIQQRRTAYKQAWREEAVRRWKSHRAFITISSVTNVATWIREDSGGDDQ